MQVYIAEYSEISNIDLPGKSCDVIFFAGCDFNCPFCNVPEMLHFREEYIYDIREIKEKPNMQNSLLKPIIIIYRTGAMPNRKKSISRVVQCASKK